MTIQQRHGQAPRPAVHWRERALERSQVITDAWEVTKTWAGLIADWILFGCMIANIVEILVEVPPPVSNSILGIQVVTLDIGGFSLATMGEHARDQGDTRAARKASRTGYFLITVTILTLLLVTVGLLWPKDTKHFIDAAEKALILVRICMTVIYGHVIHGLRRAAHSRPALVAASDVNARLDAFSEQLERLQADMQQQGRELHACVSPLVHSVVQAHTHTVMSELQAVEARVEASLKQQHITLTEAVREARSLPHGAKQPASPRKSEATVKLLPLKQQSTAPNEKRAAVYALLESNPHLSSYEIAEQTGYPPSTIQRYMRDWKMRQSDTGSEAPREASDTAS